jgi:hypothetical protein
VRLRRGLFGDDSMTAEASLLACIGNRRRRCTVGEATAGTGLSLQAVEQGLLARSGRRRLQALLQGALRLLARLTRLSFGLALLQLLAQVPATLLDLLVSGISALAKKSSSSSATLRQLWSLLWDLPGEGADPGSLGILSAVFSILFGDGDPNARLEPLRWRRIAVFLRLHGGVVIAEDLASHIDLSDCPSDPDHRRDLADAAMLPVLLRFEGRPDVREEGDLIHRFPAGPRRRARHHRDRCRQGRCRVSSRLRQRPRSAGADHRQPDRRLATASHTGPLPTSQ